MTIGLLSILLVIIIFLLILDIRAHTYGKTLGTINMRKDENGTNIWNFSFKEGVTYEMIENMDQVTFKVEIEKGVKDDQ